MSEEIKVDSSLSSSSTSSSTSSLFECLSDLMKNDSLNASFPRSMTDLRADAPEYRSNNLLTEFDLEDNYNFMSFNNSVDIFNQSSYLSSNFKKNNSQLQQKDVSYSNILRKNSNVLQTDNESLAFHDVENNSMITSHSMNQYHIENFKHNHMLSKDAFHFCSTSHSSSYIYQVHFKRASRYFIIAPGVKNSFKRGDYVKVEADRGEDMGIVINKIQSSSFKETSQTAGYRGRGFQTGNNEKKFILRLASSHEISSLDKKVHDELEALNLIRNKIFEKDLPMNVLEAEYQFDRHKLVFFFEAERRIDFRDLVNELFSLYKTRIWMQQVDTSSLLEYDEDTEFARNNGFLLKNDGNNANQYQNSNINQNPYIRNSIQDSIKMNENNNIRLNNYVYGNILDELGNDYINNKIDNFSNNDPIYFDKSLISASMSDDNNDDEFNNSILSEVNMDKDSIFNNDNPQINNSSNGAY